MPAFEFDVGNSCTGPLGLVATIVAKDKTAALTRLRALLPREAMLEAGQTDLPLADGERVSIYINYDVITVKQAELVEE